MKISKTFFLQMVALLLVSNPVYSQDSTALTATDYKNNVLFLPALGSSPETGFMLGAVIVPQFKVRSAGPGTRSSTIFTSAIYTTKKQILISIMPDIVFPDEMWTLNGNYFANYFPESYWGPGPFSIETDELTALYTQIHIEQNILRRIKPGLFSGPNLRWSGIYKVSFENSQGEQIPAPDITGNGGSTSMGLGWITRWDRRNSNMTPTRHHYVQLSFLGNPEWLGSSNQYTAYELDARKYIELRADGLSVLAVQSLLTLHSGSPSFNDLATIGGDRINRGYYSGRYRDQNAAQVQAELRQNLRGRIGFTLFAGTGEVWDRFKDFNLENYKWTAGAGLRFNMNKQDPANIRIDFGFSKESTGFYLQFGEAF